MIDYFENIDVLPEEVRKVLLPYIEDAANDSLTYEQCEDLLKQVEQHGYTFDYGLDGIPFNLRLL